MFTGYLDSVLTSIFIAGVVLVLFDVARRWYQVLQGSPVPQEAFGPPLTATGEVQMGCCRGSETQGRLLSSRAASYGPICHYFCHFARLSQFGLIRTGGTNLVP